MTRSFKATIKFDCDGNHPDAPNELGVQYSDIYHFDTDVFSGGNDVEAMKNYIRRDMALVAGGGYATDTIINVKYDIEEV
jgi:hypothetical protein